MLPTSLSYCSLLFPLWFHTTGTWYRRNAASTQAKEHSMLLHLVNTVIFVNEEYGMDAHKTISEGTLTLRYVKEVTEIACLEWKTSRYHLGMDLLAWGCGNFCNFNFGELDGWFSMRLAFGFQFHEINQKKRVKPSDICCD